MPGQRVSIDKQTPQLVEQMLDRCQALPVDFVRNIDAARASVVISNNNPYLHAHGVRVELPELLRAESNVLYPPAITYSQGEKDEVDAKGMLNWKLGQRKYLYPCLRQDSQPLVWVAVNVASGVPAADLNRFVMVGSLSIHGKLNDVWLVAGYRR